MFRSDSLLKKVYLGNAYCARGSVELWNQGIPRAGRCAIIRSLHRHRVRDRVLSMRIEAMWIPAVAAALWASPTSAAELRVKSTLDQPPRKVIVGTTMQAFWVEYPGLEKRLEQLSGLIDRMAEESKKKYGRGLDLAILPEMAVTGELSGDVAGHSWQNTPGSSWHCPS